MKKLKLLLLLVMALSFASYGQTDCSSFLASLKAESPYNLNSLSKSAKCVTGHTYEFVVPLQKGYEYRIIFYASSVFNNDLHFKMIDLNTNDVIMDLPGKLPPDQNVEKGTTVLQAYYDEKLNKEVHPYFSIIPQTATNIKIVIDVEEKTDLIQGCVTVVILDKEFEEGTF